MACGVCRWARIARGNAEWEYVIYRFRRWRQAARQRTVGSRPVAMRQEKSAPAGQVSRGGGVRNDGSGSIWRKQGGAVMAGSETALPAFHHDKASRRETNSMYRRYATYNGGRWKGVVGVASLTHRPERHTAGAAQRSTSRSKNGVY